MLKNKIVVRKIRNIVILLMVIIIMIGAYKNIDKSKAEEIIEIGAIALDNYGYLADEEFMLEAKKLEDDLYEIELPESINTKNINQIVKVTLEDIVENAEVENAETEKIEAENNEVEITENKIQLTQEQLDNSVVNVEVEYDVVILEKNEQQELQKILLSEKTVEERQQIQITEETQTLYSKILRYEDTENNKLVEVKGYLPESAELQVEEVSQEKLAEIFGDKEISVAYDIKIIRKVVTQVPVDEADPTKEPEEIVENIEINPEDFGEICEVTIKDVKIEENSQVYHVKEDNTYEEVTVKDNVEENISFEAQTFSIYAVAASSEISSGSVNEGTMLGASGTDSVLPTVSVEGIKVTGGEKIIDPQLYGKYVDYTPSASGYTNNDLGIGGWQVFYADEDNIYLITDTYINNTKVPAGSNGTSPTKYATVGVKLNTFYNNYSTISTVAPEGFNSKWLSGLGQSGWDSTLNGHEVVAYLVDEDVWSVFQDPTISDYAIGGPTLEMLFESYNEQWLGDAESITVDGISYPLEYQTNRCLLYV